MRPSPPIQIHHCPRIRTCCSLLLAMVQAGCGAGWHQPSSAAAIADLNPRQQVQLWSHGVARQLHGVRLTADSVSGIPYLMPLDCASCRITVPRPAVDSLRLGNPTEGFWRSMGVGLGALLGILIVSCATTHSCNYGD